MILFLDTFADARAGGRSTLDLAVRATVDARRALPRAARPRRARLVRRRPPLADARDGVGQRYRIVDALLESEIVFNYAWKDVSVIPARTLPPQALVLAVTPLLDDRVVAALADLAGARYDLAIVEVSPGRSRRRATSELDRLAYRLWLLRREELRARYERLGVAVGDVERRRSRSTPALEGVRAFRRHARLARA